MLFSEDSRRAPGGRTGDRAGAELGTVEGMLNRLEMSEAGDRISIVALADWQPPDADSDVDGRRAPDPEMDEMQAPLQYRVSTDKESGIVNDPNARFSDEAAFIAAARRIVQLSVETARIVDGLPSALAG